QRRLRALLSRVRCRTAADCQRGGHRPGERGRGLRGAAGGDPASAPWSSLLQPDAARGAIGAPMYTQLQLRDSDRPPVTLSTLERLKQQGEKIACLTAYDASFAAVLDAAGVEVVLVGD